jgi:hypothetical protein
MPMKGPLENFEGKEPHGKQCFQTFGGPIVTDCFMVPFNKQIPETVSSWLLAGLFSHSTGWNARLASQRLAGLESWPTVD